MGIVVPAFNSSWSIGDTVRSIRAQRLADFRCIVVDDGSADEIGPAISAATNGDRRFEIVRQDNGGLAAARNRGLEDLRTPFTAFIDSDDLWHPDFLLRLVEALENAPDAPFAYSHSLRIDRDNRLIPTVRWPHEPRHDVGGLLSINTVASGSAAVFRTDALRGAGAFDPSFRSMGAEGAEDWHLSLRLAAEAHPVLVPDYLAVYRLNEQGMSQGDPARQLRAASEVMKDIRRRYPKLRGQHFRDARTAINGWLLAAVLRRQGLRRVAGLLAQSYLLNPLWFLNRDLRTLHLMKIRTAVGSRGPRPMLAEIEDPEGTRPFDFLDETRIDSQQAIDGEAAEAHSNSKDR